jgi:hypothetical protein
LLEQTPGEFEWLIGLNNCDVELPPCLDLGVHGAAETLSLPQGSSVGALKKELCSRATGEYLVELDHDDELVPYALATIRDAINEHEAAHGSRPDFLYSDSVHVFDGKEDEPRADRTHVYSGYYGWPAPYTMYHKGCAYDTQRAFPITAASLHDIFFSPDHVRVWRREFYERIGGHDSNLPVADDHELLIRTYIEGGSMAYIPECLYIYHVHADGSNTYLERNREIQDQQARNGVKYRYALIREWCRREELIRLELGGGRTYKDTGVLGIALANADLCLDVLEEGLSRFEDNSVGHIHAQDFLEHIPHCRNSRCTHQGRSDDACVVYIMNEIHRVLAPNGWFTSSTPSSDGRGAFQDPTHCSFWNPNSFWYYTRAEQAAFVPGITARFLVKDISQNHPDEWCKTHDIPYVHAALTALKEDHQPGANSFWLP